MNISPNWIPLSDLSKKNKITLSKESEELIKACREFLDQKLSISKQTYYGVNTGFGSLCNTSINESMLETLQENLLRSHACGIGEVLDFEIIDLMLLLKIKNLSYGLSATQLQTVQLLIEFYNRDIRPVIYEQGSLGASGDLIPLAHMSLPLMGEGEVFYKGNRSSAREVLELENLLPIKLKSKEGLALINGTQFMNAHLVHSLNRSTKLLKWADLIASLSFDAFDCKLEPLNKFLHVIRNHSGQIETAKSILENLEGSEIAKQHKVAVQDPYSFRCIPQVHGATKDFVNYAIGVCENEVNAVTDNPTVFPEEDLILSGGNFHGQPIAILMDQLAIALSEIGSISERRVYKLISGQRGLPEFLVKEPGLNSGLMILQYSAASVVSQNKQLSTPSSVDTIDSSNGQEDHVSMGANAATKLKRVVDNIEKILAIELINASQAISFRKMKTSSKLETILSDFRTEVPLIQKDDTILNQKIVQSINFLKKYKI